MTSPKLLEKLLCEKYPKIETGMNSSLYDDSSATLAFISGNGEKPALTDSAFYDDGEVQTPAERRAIMKEERERMRSMCFIFRADPFSTRNTHSPENEDAPWAARPQVVPPLLCSFPVEIKDETEYEGTPAMDQTAHDALLELSLTPPNDGSPYLCSYDMGDGPGPLEIVTALDQPPVSSIPSSPLTRTSPVPSLPALMSQSYAPALPSSCQYHHGAVKQEATNYAPTETLGMWGMGTASTGGHHLPPAFSHVSRARPSQGLYHYSYDHYPHAGSSNTLHPLPPVPEPPAYISDPSVLDRRRSAPVIFGSSSMGGHSSTHLHYGVFAPQVFQPVGLGSTSHNFLPAQRPLSALLALHSHQASNPSIPGVHDHVNATSPVAISESYQWGLRYPEVAQNFLTHS